MKKRRGQDASASGAARPRGDRGRVAAPADSHALAATITDVEARAVAQRVTAALAFGDADVEAALARGLSLARARWPGLAVDADALAGRLRALLAHVPDPTGAIVAANVRDLVLACGCLANDAVALAALERDVLAKLTGALSRLLPARADRDEVLQIVRARLLVGDGERPPYLATYAGRGALRSLCALMALRLAMNVVRDRRREHLVAGDDALGWDRGLASVLDGGAVAQSPDPERAAMKRDHKDDMEALVRVALGALGTRERNLLRQAYIDGLTVDELGALYGVHRATAARWLVQARAAVREEVRRLFVARGVGAAEVDSLIRVLRSGLDITLSGVLDET